MSPARDSSVEYVFRLSNLSGNVKLDQLYQLFSSISTNLHIQILPSSYLAPAPSSAPYLLKDSHERFNKEAEITVGTHDEVARLFGMVGRLKDYGITLTPVQQRHTLPSAFSSSDQEIPRTLADRSFPLATSSFGLGRKPFQPEHQWSDHSPWREKSQSAGFHVAGSGDAAGVGSSRDEEYGVFMLGMEEDVAGFRQSDQSFTKPTTAAMYQIDPLAAPIVSPWPSSRLPTSSRRSETDSFSSQRSTLGFGSQNSVASASRKQLGMPRNLYVLNLPPDLSQLEFETMFERFGEVEHACLLSMLDQHGRRRGFLLMSKHEEARKVLNEVNGKTFRGFRLDVSWSQVQKEAAEDIQRGRTHSKQRFLPPPICPNNFITEPLAMQLPPLPAHARVGSMAAPHGFGTAWIKDDGPTKIAMTFDEAVQPVRGGFLACIVVMDDLPTARVDIPWVLDEASLFGQVTYACFMTPTSGLSQTFAFPQRQDVCSVMLRYASADSARSCIDATEKDMAYTVRAATWSDLDRLTGEDRKRMLEARPQAVSTTWSPFDETLVDINAPSFKTGTFVSPAFKSSMLPAITPPSVGLPPNRTPSSPLLAYSRNATEDHIWKPKGNHWGAVGWKGELPCRSDSDGSSGDDSGRRKQEEEKLGIRAPTAVWWQGAIAVNERKVSQKERDAEDHHEARDSCRVNKGTAKSNPAKVD